MITAPMSLRHIPDDAAFEFYRSFLEWYVRYHKPAYLELGCGAGGLLYRLASHCSYAVGVDSTYHVSWDKYRQAYSGDNVVFHHMSTDDYFHKVWPLSEPSKFGLVFIDASHKFDNVLEDTMNVWRYALADDGLMVLHDTLPPTKKDTSQKRCGDAWRIVSHLRHTVGIQVLTLPVKYGLTLVSREPVLAW